MALVDLPVMGGFFKSEEWGQAALLLEPTNFEPQRPTNYGPKDTVTANIVAFDEGGNVVKEVTGILIQQVALVSTLKQALGGATVAKLTQGKAKQGQRPPWIFVVPETDLKAKVAAFYNEREAQKQAVLASDDTPDWLK